MWQPCFCLIKTIWGNFIEAFPLMLHVKYFSIWSYSFREQDFLMYHLIRNKNCPWRPCFLSYPDNIKKLCKEPYINAFCKVWFHFAQPFQRRNVKVYRWQTDPKWWQKLILPLADELTNPFLQFTHDFDHVQLLC